MAGSVPGMATRGLVGLMLAYLLAIGQAITVEVPPRQKLCFFQYYEEGTSAQAEIFVENGGNLDIRFTVEGPFQEDANGLPTKESQLTDVVYDRVVSSSTSFLAEDQGPNARATADGLELKWMARAGAYSLCLDNSNSYLQSKVVEFSAPDGKKNSGSKGLTPDEHAAAAALAGNASLPDSIKASYKADLEILRKSADRIATALKDVQEKQQKERHRLALQTSANENNHNHMVVSSLFETVVFIGVSVFQLFYVQRWFEGKDVGGRGRRQWA